MSKVKTICVCDRCGEEIKYGVFPRKKMKINSTIIMGFGDYDFWEYDYDLCRQCTKEFQKFMKSEE